jgi:hypothetical protein
MTPHYYINQDEMQSHPDMALLREEETLPLYKAAHRLGRAFLCSTSGWSSKHTDALKVLQFRNFPLKRLCPVTCIIPETSDLAQKVRNAFSLPAEDVKASRYDSMLITSRFYDELSTLLRTSKKTPSPIIRDSFPKRQTAPFTYSSPSDHDPDTIMGMSFGSTSEGSSFTSSRSPQRNSTNDQNDIREIVTNNMIIAFLSILSSLAYPEKNPVKTRPEFNALPDAFKFTLMGAQLTSENDGSGWKKRWSKSEKQWVTTGGAPLVTIEVQSKFSLTDIQKGQTTVSPSSPG